MPNDIDLYASKKHNLLFLKQQKIFNDLYNKRFDRMGRLSNEIDFIGLDYV